MVKKKFIELKGGGGLRRFRLHRKRRPAVEVARRAIGVDGPETFERYIREAHSIKQIGRTKGKGEIMGRIDENEAIAWEDDKGNLFCAECGDPDGESYPLTAEDLVDEEGVFICDGCKERIR